MTSSDQIEVYDQRMRFELWFSEQYKEVASLQGDYWFPMKSGIYERIRTRVAWEAWQAALKSKQGEV